MSEGGGKYSYSALACVSLRMGQIVSILGCGSSVIGFFYAAIYTLGESSARADLGISPLDLNVLFGYWALALLISIVAFLYSFAMCVVFTVILHLGERRRPQSREAD